MNKTNAFYVIQYIFVKPMMSSDKAFYLTHFNAYFRNLNMKNFQRVFITSGLLFKMSPLFEYLLYNNSYETVLLNKIQGTYNRFVGNSVYWFRSQPPDELKENYKQTFSELNQIINCSYDPTNIASITVVCNKKLENNLPFLEHIQKRAKVQFNTNFLPQARNNPAIFPNFSIVTGSNKKIINQHRFNIYFILAGQNYKQARQDYIGFLRFCLKKKNDLFHNQENFVDTYEEMTQPIFRDCNKQIRWYTKQSFHFKVINTAMKGLTFAEDIAYFRFPIFRLFISVAQLSQKQSNSDQRKSGFICFRGCNLSDAEIRRLENMIGQVIQLQGWVSASKFQHIAKGFGGVMIIIQVPPFFQKSRLSIYDCFADVSKQSDFPKESQIIFNPLNHFYVKDVKNTKDQKQITLRFVYAYEIQQSANIPGFISQQVLKNLKSFFTYQTESSFLIKTQGQNLFRIKSQNDIQFYMKKLSSGIELAHKSDLQYYSGQFQLQKPLTMQLFKALKKTISFQWPTEENRCLAIVNHHIRNNFRNCGIIFFSIAQTGGCSCEQGLVFLLVGTILLIRMTRTLCNYLVNVYTSNLGIRFQKAHLYDCASSVYSHIYRHVWIKFSKQYTITQYPFLYAPLLFYSKIADIQKTNQIRPQIINYITGSTRTTEQKTQWINLANNFDDFFAVTKFIEYYSSHYNNLPYWIHTLVFEAALNLYQIQKHPQSAIQDIKQASFCHELLKVVRNQNQISLKQYGIFQPGIKLILIKVLLSHQIGQQYRLQLAGMIRQKQKYYFRTEIQDWENFRVRIVALKCLLQCYQLLGEEKKNGSKYLKYLSKTLIFLRLSKYRNHYSQFLMILNICEYYKTVNDESCLGEWRKALIRERKLLKVVLKWDEHRFVKIST